MINRPNVIDASAEEFTKRAFVVSQSWTENSPSVDFILADGSTLTLELGKFRLDENGMVEYTERVLSLVEVASPTVQTETRPQVSEGFQCDTDMSEPPKLPHGSPLLRSEVEEAKLAAIRSQDRKAEALLMEVEPLTKPSTKPSTGSAARDIAVEPIIVGHKVAEEIKLSLAQLGLNATGEYRYYVSGPLGGTSLRGTEIRDVSPESNGHRYFLLDDKYLPVNASGGTEISPETIEGSILLCDTTQVAAEVADAVKAAILSSDDSAVATIRNKFHEDILPNSLKVIDASRGGTTNESILQEITRIVASELRLIVSEDGLTLDLKSILRVLSKQSEPTVEVAAVVEP